MIDFEITLKLDHGANGIVDTGVVVLGTFETSFGLITAINLDNGPTIYPNRFRTTYEVDTFANLLTAQLAERYRHEIDAERHQQSRDVAETHPHRAARDRVYADLMG